MTDLEEAVDFIGNNKEQVKVILGINEKFPDFVGYCRDAGSVAKGLVGSLVSCNGVFGQITRVDAMYTSEKYSKTAKMMPGTLLILKKQLMIVAHKPNVAGTEYQGVVRIGNVDIDGTNVSQSSLLKHLDITHLNNEYVNTKDFYIIRPAFDIPSTQVEEREGIDGVDSIYVLQKL